MIPITLDYRGLGSLVKSTLNQPRILFLREGERPNDVFRQLVEMNAISVKIQKGLKNVELKSEDIQFLKETEYDVDLYSSFSQGECFNIACDWLNNTKSFHPSNEELLNRMFDLMIQYEGHFESLEYHEDMSEPDFEFGSLLFD